MSLQTLDRAIELLRRLGHGGESGLRLIEIQRELKLARPTAHRLVTTLANHGLVVRDEPSKRYRLGWELAVLGWSVPRPGLDLREICQEIINRLAQETGDTIILSARSGLDHVCIDRKAGHYPIKVFTVEVGTRRPLGVGAGSLAMLATMSDEEIDAALNALKPRLAAYPDAPIAAIREAARAARKRGYAISDGLVLRNVRGVAVAIRDARGTAIGALGAASIVERTPDRRLPQIGKLLLQERDRIEHRLRDKASGT